MVSNWFSVEYFWRSVDIRTYAAAGDAISARFELSMRPPALTPFRYPHAREALSGIGPARDTGSLPNGRGFAKMVWPGALTLFLHPYTRARALMARQWSARCYGVARQRDASRQNSIGGRVNPFPSPLHAREGADGQAVVCPLLRGSSPTRWVAPKQHRGAR